jgi:peptidoglycan DL-endopeptidase CwlO
VRLQTGRPLAALLALTVTAAGVVVALAAPAGAAPGDTGDDGEGASRTLIQQLETASRGYLEAREALARSTGQQRALTARLAELDSQVGPRQAAFDEIVRQSYRTGRLGPMKALLAAGSAGGLLDRAETLETVAVKERAVLDELLTTRDEQRRAKAAIDAAVRDQRRQVALMAKRKAQAETALKAADAGRDDPQPGDGGGSGRADPAPRNSDGSLPAEGCSVNDPTTSGCLTPRTLHALRQAKSAGFTHFAACFRQQNSGEHPRGRACDFAADKDGFGGVATGSSKTYGTRLANYFINNSGRLGVLYVIWFKRIWLPSSGWKSYSRGNGDPSSDHTNHVHLSVR